MGEVPYGGYSLLLKCVQQFVLEKRDQLKGSIAIPLSVFHSMFAPVFGAIAHQFSDLRDPAGKDRLYRVQSEHTNSFTQRHKRRVLGYCHFSAFLD